MKTVLLFSALCWLASGGLAYGEDLPSLPGPPTIGLSEFRALPGLPLGRAPDSTAISGVPLSVYGGSTLNFPVVVQAPLGSRLTLTGDLWQVGGGRLAAPVRKDIRLGPELVFTDRTSIVATCTLPELPAVRSVAHQVLLLWVEGGPPSGAGRTFAVSVDVYPREEPGAWKQRVAAGLAQSGLRRLAIFGTSQNFRRFLRAEKVNFEDLGAEWPNDPDNHTLYVGEHPAGWTSPGGGLLPAGFKQEAGLRLVLIAPSYDSPLPPGVYESASANNDVWKVTLPDFCTDLEMHPQKLAALAEVLRLALQPRRALLPPAEIPFNNP